MSWTLHTLDAGQQLLAAVPHAAAGGGSGSGSTGIIDWINVKAASANVAVKNVAVVIATLLVLLKAWLARGAITAIIVAAITAAILLWIVNNIGQVQGRVGNEVNSLRAPVVRVVDAPSAPVLLGRAD